jgi:hypothetical protein
VKTRGTVIKIPGAGPGLIFVDGQQKKFVVEGMWLSPIAPALNQSVEIEWGAPGEIAWLTVTDQKGTDAGPSDRPTSSTSSIPRPIWPTEPVAGPAPASAARVGTGVDQGRREEAGGNVTPTSSAPSHVGRNLAIIAAVALVVVGIAAAASSSTHYTDDTAPSRTPPLQPAPDPPSSPSAPPLPLPATANGSGQQGQGEGTDKQEDDEAPDPQVVRRVRRILGSTDVGSFILAGYLHWGAPYHGHQFIEEGRVSQNDKPVPRQFSLVYRFKWDVDGVTDLAFLCTATGQIFQVEVIKTNAQLSQPFVAADIAIKAGTFGLAAALDDQLTDEQKQKIVEAGRQADAKAGLEAALSVLTLFQ